MSITKLRQRLNVPPPSPRAVPEAVVPSLPPAPSETTLSPAPNTPSAIVVPKVKIPNIIEKDSVIRRKAVAIVAMRAQGYTNEEIATELRIKPASVHTYIYRATRSGFLVNKRGSMLDDPKDRTEFELAHKVVRNLNEFMDSNDDDVRKEVTMEVAKGTLFKKFDAVKEATAPAMQVLAIKIDMPQQGGAAMPAVDVTSMGGQPAYSEGEVADDE